MLETNWIELNVAADGTVTWRESANVYQFSNETVGVRIYAPFDPHSESALINIRLPDDTVLQEKPMTHVVDGDEEEGIHKWQYAFDGLATALTGYDYAASIVLSFRFVDISKSPSQTTNQVSVPIQPSLQGEAMYVDPSAADTLHAMIGYNSAKIEDIAKNIGTIRDDAESAKEYAEQAAGSAQAAEESAHQASGSAEEAVSVSKRADERSSQALDIADGVKANLDQAVEDSANAFRISNESNAKSDEAVATAEEAKEIATYAKEGSGTAVHRSNGDTQEFVPVVELVSEKGQSEDAVMTQKAVTDALLETVEVSELSGEILTIPDTEEGALEDYRILGKSVQYISPNLFDVEKAKAFENWVMEGDFYYFDIQLKPSIVYNFNCSENLGTGSNVWLAVVGDKLVPIINSSVPDVNYKKISFTSTSSGLVRLRLTKASSLNVANIFTNILPNCQINEGTTALPYEPYTGTPAPDNPIEIQSVESPVNVVSCGTNLFDINDNFRISNGTKDGNAIVSTDFNWCGINTLYDVSVGFFRAQVNPKFFLRSGKYTVSFNAENANEGTASYIKVACSDSFGNYPNFFSVPFINGNLYAFNITVPSDDYYSICFAPSGDLVDSPILKIYNIQLTMGTYTASNMPPYEPYQRIETSITVTGTDGTVYPLRGIGDVHDEVDFDRNVLIQRVGEYVWSGEGVFGQQSANDSDLTTVFFSSYLHVYQNCKALMDNSEKSAVLFNRFPIDMTVYVAKDLQGAYISSNVTFRINKSIANTANDFKAWLAENPVTVVYPLAEPVEIPLQTLPAIPTMDGTTTITTTNTPAPELYCTEYMDAQMGNPVTLKSLNEVINPVTSAELVFNRNTKNTVARDITELQMKNTDQDKQIDTLNEKLYSTDPTKVIPVKKAETANVVPLKYLLDTIYPVGSIYISTVDNSPMNFLGGTWERITGDAYLKIVSSGAGSKAGSNTHNHNPGLLRANVSSTTDGIDIYEITNDAYSWNANYRVSGTTSSVSVSHASVVPIVGTTADATINPYYYGVYVWKRTA